MNLLGKILSLSLIFFVSPAISQEKETRLEKGDRFAVVYTTEWCPSCKILKNELNENRRKVIKSILTKFFIVDSEKTKTKFKILENFGKVSRFPTTIVYEVDEDGNAIELGRIVGFSNAESFLGFLKKWDLNEKSRLGSISSEERASN